MINDHRLLSELYDLKDTRVVEYLRGLRDEAVGKWTDSTSDREATLAQGEKRVLDRIIKDIESAWDIMQKQKKDKQRPDMRQAF